MMQTPWGDVPLLRRVPLGAVSDAHVHFFSPPFFQSLAEQKGVDDVGPLLGWEVPESAEYLAERWVVELNHNDVETAMLIASIPGDVESVGTAVDLFPERFHSVVMMNPMAPGVDMRISSALSDSQVNGVFLFPAMHRYSLHDHHVHSLLSILAGYTCAIVYVHCGMLSVGFRKRLGLASHFDMRFSNPIDLHALALSFPNLPFVIPHFGAGYFREALMVARMCPNVYFDTSSSNSWMRLQTPELDFKTVMRQALDVVGPRRLLFGTDSSFFPRGWVRDVFATQIEALEAAGVTAEEAKAVLGGNLRRLMKKV